MRKNGKVDANQPQIVRVLRQAGASVVSLADVGDGCGDLLVGYRGANWFMELKDWRQPVSKRRLTPMEKKFHAGWQGQIAIIETADEALKLIGAVKISG